MIVKRLVLVVVLVVLAGIIAGSAQTPRCTKAIDPVCGLCVEKDPKLSVTYKGETFYFCTNEDAKIFKENPAKYPKR
jgi:YHS domain-containing protein